jgi:hypothetical protein
VIKPEAVSAEISQRAMPDIDADGCRIHVEIEGPEQAPVLVLSNSLATTLHMWDGQLVSMTSLCLRVARSRNYPMLQNDFEHVGAKY